jgi:hypothetical protein
VLGIKTISDSSSLIEEIQLETGELNCKVKEIDSCKDDLTLENYKQKFER